MTRNHTCMHAYMAACMWLHTYGCTHIWLHACIMAACMHIWLHAYMAACIMAACMHIWLHACMHAMYYMRAPACMFSATCMHMHGTCIK
jgi:hypothetical protein